MNDVMFRFSRRQVERKARKLQLAEEEKEEEAEGSRDGSRSGTPLRSCSPASTRSVIEAAMARKSNANDTNRTSFTGQRRRGQRHRMRKKSSSGRDVSSSRESRSSRSSGAPLRTRKAEQPESSLDFGMAALSEKQKKSLNAVECSGSPKVSKRNPSLDLTCSETMSLDIENLSTSPGSLQDSSPSEIPDSPVGTPLQGEAVRRTTPSVETEESEINIDNAEEMEFRSDKEHKTCKDTDSEVHSEMKNSTPEDEEKEESLDVDFDHDATREELDVDNISPQLLSSDVCSALNTEEHRTTGAEPEEHRDDVEKVIQDIVMDVEEQTKLNTKNL